MCCEMDVDIRLFVIGSRESWSRCFWGKMFLEGPGGNNKAIQQSSFHSEPPECTVVRSVYSVPYEGTLDGAVS
jgi:hypothetical protein